ncbi:MAG: hypothetical protein CL676_06405 [Bdellovibrionaceae bacterium]|nr:hypothetical protein [Pseudobdellovibrionaceae bacterium]
MKALPRNQAVFELILAALFWGFGYVATVWALDMVTAIELTFLRFLFGGFFTLFFVRSFHMDPKRFWRLVRLSFWPGLFMALLLTSQTVGLKYTTAVNSTFITSLYVVITPFFQWGFLKQRSHPVFFLYAFLSMAGVYLILQGSFHAPASSLSWFGDLLTLVTALFSAAHLVYVGKIWRDIQRPFLFNSLQSLWAGLMLLPLLFAEGWISPGPEGAASLIQGTGQVSLKAMVGFLSLVFGSTVISFFLQLRAQSVLSPSLTSLLCLLESPLALIFAIFLLSQPLTLWALGGAGLIFISAVGATWSESRAMAESAPKG